MASFSVPPLAGANHEAPAVEHSTSASEAHSRTPSVEGPAPNRVAIAEHPETANANKDVLVLGKGSLVVESRPITPPTTFFHSAPPAKVELREDAPGMHGSVAAKAEAGAARTSAPIDDLAADHGYSLTLMFIPQEVPVDWSSPGRMARTGIRGALAPERFLVDGRLISLPKHVVGHALVELKGKGEKPILTSMTSDDGVKAELDLAWERNLGGLLASRSGKEMDLEVTQQELRKRYATGRILFVTHKISESTYERLANYYQQYKERGYDSRFGLENRPRYGEGAGCTEYAHSFLELGGLVEDAYANNWVRTVDIDERLIGDEKEPPEVGALRVFFSRSLPWTRENHPSRHVEFWDPQLAVEWIEDTFAANDNPKFARARRGRAWGLVIDSRDKATPNEPIWLHETESPVQP